MILRSIRVANWRCFLEEIQLGPFGDGLSVIHAPNGSGKSTLFEALRHALLDGHRVSGKEVEALRPWGRELAPRVTVEFTDGGRHYRIFKQFLDSPRALLERMEEDRYRPLAEGASADEKAREILSKNPPGRGLARLENFGIAQVLWAPQGNLAVGPLSGEVVADIRNLLSAQMSGTSSGPIEKKIEERYLEFFSAKGKMRTGKEAPRLVRIQEAIEEAKEECRKARDLYLAFENVSRRVEELQSRRTQAGRNADALRDALREARKVAEAYGILKAERGQREERVKTAEAQYKEVDQRLETLRTLVSDCEAACAVIKKLEEELPLREGEVQEWERETAKLKSELEDARKGREAVEEAESNGEVARRFQECIRDWGRLDGLTSKINEADKRLAQLRQERNALVAPDSKLLRAIRKAIKERDEARLQIEASLITLEIVPQQDGSVEVVTGEKTGRVALKSGIPTQIQGAPEVAAELTQIARLRAWGPVGGVEEHREAYSRAERKLADLTMSFGTADPDVLESLLEKALELDGSIAKGETELQTLLSGQTREEIAHERAVVETNRARFIETHPEWIESMPDSHALETVADNMRRAFNSRVDAAEAAWEKAYKASTSASGQRDKFRNRLEDAKRQVTELNAKIERLTRDGKNQQGLERERQQAAMAWEAARTRLKEIEEKLALYFGDPVATCKSLEAQLTAADEEAQGARDQEVREETKLEGLCVQGPYSTLAVTEERLQQLQQDSKREEIRMEAIRLLHETVVKCRSEAITAVSAPVEALATRTLQRIAGRRLGHVQVGESFEPAAVLPDSLDAPVTLDNLSGGEQEQLYLAIRLALAEVLGREERQLVVLDDVLTATDSGRLAKVMTILEEAAQRFQLLVLTCHPERYRGLRNTSFFDLEGLAYKTDLIQEPFL